MKNEKTKIAITFELDQKQFAALDGYLGRENAEPETKPAIVAKIRSWLTEHTMMAVDTIVSDAHTAARTTNEMRETAKSHRRKPPALAMG